MFIIDFNQSTARAFEHGFLKGLSAPVMLFHSEPSPKIPQFAMLAAPTVPLQQSLAGDWHRVGIDMQKVISAQYEKQPAATQKINRKRR